VESVLAQSGPDVRVLIIDDASPDNTVEVAISLAKKDSRVSFRHHLENKGHIATYNEGIQWASADYLLILSADDYLLPSALSRSTNLMDTYPEVGFTYGKVIEINDSDITMLKRPNSAFAEKDGWSILGGMEFIKFNGAQNNLRTPTVVVRTELQKRVGGYRAELPHSGDMEMWLRLAVYASVGKLEAYQAVYRRHIGNMSLLYSVRSSLPDLQQRKAALDLFFQTCSSDLLDARNLRRRLVRSLALEAVGCASAAFNSGEKDLSAELSEFALSLSPRVKRSMRWTKLTCKRCLGFRMWRVMQPAVESIRKASLLLRETVR
jgi:glycosyltransferase involved in cell wall biosynthesis